MSDKDAQEIVSAVDEIKTAHNSVVEPLREAQHGSQYAFDKPVTAYNEAGKRIGEMLTLLRRTAERIKAPLPTNAPPSLFLTSPQSGSTFTVGQSAQIRASATDSVALSEFRLFRNGVQINSQPVSGTAASYSFDDAPQEGAYAYALRVYDSGGLTAEQNFGATFIPPVSGGSVNIAQMQYGAIGEASSTHPDWSPYGPIGGSGPVWPMWGSNTSGVFPVWWAGTLPNSQNQAIRELVFKFRPDVDAAPSDFQVQQFTGGVWTTVTGGSFTGQAATLKEVRIPLSPAVTNAFFRIYYTAASQAALNAAFGYSFLAGFEAWTEGPPVDTAPTVTIVSPTANQSFQPNTQVTVRGTTFDSNFQKTEVYRVSSTGAEALIGTITTIGSWTINDTPPVGTTAYKVIGYDTTSHTTTKTVAITVTDVATLSSGNWEQRRQAPGVVKSWALEDGGLADANLSGKHASSGTGPRHSWGVMASVPGTGSPFIDSSIKPPGGEASLAFVCPSGGGAGHAGTMFFNMSGGSFDAGQFPTEFVKNVGEELYVQLLFYPNEAYMETTLQQFDGAGIGKKIFDVTSSDVDMLINFGSSTGSKVVVASDAVGHAWRHLYHYGPDRGGDPGLYEGRTGGDTDLQPRGDANYLSYLELANTPAAASPTYVSPKAKGVFQKDKWNHIQLGISIIADLGQETLGGERSGTQIIGYHKKVRYRLWGGAQGQEPELITDTTNGERGQAEQFQWVDTRTDGVGGLGRTILFPLYLTNKSLTQVHGLLKVNCARLIMSRQKIPDPLEITVNANPAWRPGMPINEFAPIASSTMGNKNFNGPPYEPWNTAAAGPQVVWHRDMIDAWGGFQFDRLRGHVYNSFAGGHASFIQKNGVQRIKFSDDAPEWGWLKSSSPYPASSGGRDTLLPPNGIHYSDGGPAGQHLFNYGRCVETTEGPVLVSLENPYATNQDQGVARANNAFRVNANSWYGFAKNPDGSTRALMPVADAAYDSEAVDPRTQLIWHCRPNSPSANLFTWNEETKVLTAKSTNSNALYTYGYGMCIDTERDRAVWAGDLRSTYNGGPKYWIICDNISTNPTWSRVQIQSGTGFVHIASGLPSQLSNLQYDSLNDKYVVLESTGGYVVEVDPETWVPTYLTTAPFRPGNQGNQIGATFDYSELFRGFIYIPRFEQPAYFMARGA